ncbi:DUF5979 domain-containing protein, partial [Bradyrhizobium sp.]
MKTLQIKAALTAALSARLRAAIGTLAALLLLCAFSLDAQAQNLIQNPGFENNPPPNLGNNIGWSISPWIVGGGQQPNVVKVDGPGGYNYGNNGPESDATAPGSGKAQHYLDIADGTNKFYQSFTVPTCAAAPAGTTAKVTFGGYFSGRGDSGGTATIQLLQGSGLTGAVIQTLTAVVPAGKSQTDPWIQVSGTASLVYGSTFSYVVDMPNPMNFDNASLTIEANPCPTGGDTTPVIKGCLENTKVAVKCNSNGTYTVTLNGSSFSATDITMTSQTAGVTVTPPQQPWSATTTWTVTGATAGQTVVLTANATTVGGGKDGTDLCCSGEITIVMPECPKHEVGQVVVEKKVKNDTKASNATINALNFPINLTCGPPSTLNTTFNLNNGGSHTENNVPYTSLCTVTESVSTLPAVPKDVCEKGSTAVWATPVIVPPSATINAPLTTFTVVNELSCKKIGDVGSLVVAKKVKNGTNASNAMINALVFPIGVSCGPPSNLNVNFNLNNGGSHTENNIPYTSLCTVTESVSTLPAVPKDACPKGSTAVWLTPVIVPPNATINAPLTAFTVVNELQCKKLGEVGSLVVKKEVKYDGPITLPSQTYPVTVTCGSTVTNLNLVPGVPQTVSNIPLNTSCSVVEGTVTTPPNVCPKGTTPVWSTAYAPPSPLIINGTVTETITNTLTCVKGDVCQPPLVMIPGGLCGCPPGTVLVGKECIKPICPPPMIPGPVLGQCICPPGTVQSGKECVKPHTCPLPFVIGPDDRCICPPGTVQSGNECVKPHTCPSPFVMGPDDRCICPSGTVQSGNECVKPHTCP